MSFYKEIKFYDNSFWLKVFFHSNKGGLHGFENEAEAKYCVGDQFKYSILSKINEKFKINNAYEFIIKLQLILLLCGSECHIVCYAQ